MITFPDLQKKHYALLAIESSRQEFSPEEVEQVVQFIEDLKQGGRSVYDAQERDQLRAFLRHWTTTLSQIAKDLGYQVADLESYAGPRVPDKRIAISSVALPVLVLLVGLVILYLIRPRTMPGPANIDATNQAIYIANTQTAGAATQSAILQLAPSATAAWMTGDEDRDGLTNQQELAYNTLPNNRDTDGDGVADGLDPDPLARPTEEATVPTPLPTSSPTAVLQGPVVTLVQPENGIDVTNNVQFSGMYANLNPTWTIHLFVQSEAEANRYFLIPESFTIPDGETRGEWGISIALNSVFDLAIPDRYIITPVVSLSPEIMSQVEAEASKGIAKIPDSMIRFDRSSIILYRKALRAVQGPHIVYSRQNLEQGQYDIVLASVDGITVIQEFGLQLYSEIDPEISPDGTQIIYVRRQQGSPGKFSYSLWIQNITDNTRFQLVSSDENLLYEHPRWSPDGANIAFVQRSEAENSTSDG